MQALKRAGFHGKISSKQAEMFEQDASSFTYWLLYSDDTTDDHKRETLNKILAATDWEVDSE